MLKLNIITPRDFINPLLAKKSIDKDKFDKFIEQLEILKQLNQKESEEHQKNVVKDFIHKSFGYEVNTKGRIDLAVFQNHKVEVIMEAKRLDNITEMITQAEPNRKAFSEAIKYFMDERKDGNNNLKHIIILTAFEWVIFDAKDFDKLFWQDKDFRKIHDDYTNPNNLLSKTGDVYEEIKKLVATKKSKINIFEDLEIECAYFNFKTGVNASNEKELISIYKLLSPDSLLKEFNPNDANSLNREFYNELLYILGLEEVKNGSKKLIGQSQKPQKGSFYENISNKLGHYTKPNDFETIIKLIIIWINRILFLKLLEGQIVSWNDNNKDYKFLNSTKINDFDKLEMLFFEILAKKIANRGHREFDYIPYLNSSLFEIHEQEDKSLKISNLSDDATMEYYSRTVIKDANSHKKTGEVSTLAYIFEFLDSYDFGSGSNDDIFASTNKTLINASVLGLIFEKINGYKDGSFYTPSFITSYMARESLQKSILDKFNHIFEDLGAKNWNELVRYSDKHSHKDEFINSANSMIDSITICDPAVGSGHFLVSVLNEIIYIKHQLGLYSIKGLDIKLSNDELIVFLHDEPFNYTNPKDLQSPNHQVQKLLFSEKQRIIENQLFGVDINPNSTQITKLRLWIELLKNSYYDEVGQLVTLPNIDINIKTGNSLISRFELKDELKINNIKSEIKHYKQIVQDYKENLGTKKDVMTSIQNLKDKFTLSLKAEYKLKKELESKLKTYVNEYGYEKLTNDLTVIAVMSKFGQTANLFGDEPDTKKQAKLLVEIGKLQAGIEEVESGAIYHDAFEWRFEFPEVLDENGDFVGFDIVIGNPPYIMEDDNKSAFEGLRDKPCYQGKTDIWHIFTCQGLNVLKQNGTISYIAKNQWLESQSASNMRKTIYENGNILSIIDFGTNMVFEEASQQTMVLFIKKDTKNLTHQIAYKKVINNISNVEIARLLFEMEDENLKITIKEIPKIYDEKANLTFSSSKNEEILSKIEKLKNFEFDEKKEMIQGIIGGPDEAFIVKSEDLATFNEDEKNYLKMLHTNTGKYFTKESDKYIFYISKKNFDDKNIEDFPNIKAFFEPNKAKLEDAKVRYKTSSKPYLYLHRERDESFFKKGDKIVWAKRTEGAKFTFTNESFYGTANLFFIKSNRVNLKYITALLNSKLMFFYMHERLKHTGDLLQIDKNQFMKIPLYNYKEQQPFIELVDKIMDMKKVNSRVKHENDEIAELENQIDKMVYKLYDLSDEEITIVEGK